MVYGYWKKDMIEWLLYFGNNWIFIIYILFSWKLYICIISRRFIWIWMYDKWLIEKIDVFIYVYELKVDKKDKWKCFSIFYNNGYFFCNVVVCDRLC